MVVYQEMWSPVVFGVNPEYLCPSNRKWNHFLPLLLRKNTFNVKYIENGERYAYVMVINNFFGSMTWF